MVCLTSDESPAFVSSLFVTVLHLGDSGAKLQGPLGQHRRAAEAQLLRRLPQEEFLPDAAGQRQIRLLPHGQRAEEAHHVLVQVGEPETSEFIN